MSAEVYIFIYLIGQRLILRNSEFLVEGPGLNVSWRADDDGTNIILSEEFVQPQPFGELGDHALDAIEYYCYKRVSIMSKHRLQLIYYYTRSD